MAFTEFCCRSGGSNLNAGTRTGSSTVPGTAADLTYASGSWVSSTGVFTVASGDPVADGVAVGDFASVYADGATVTTLVGRVTARTTTTITVSTTIKSGTTTDGTLTRTLKIGGAWQGPNGTSGFPLNFLTSACANTYSPNRINMKNDATYNITAAITNSTASFIQGFTSAYEDGGKFTLDGGTTGASYALMFLGTSQILIDAILQNNGATGSEGGLKLGSYCIGFRVVVHDVRGYGFTMQGAGANLFECEAYNCGQSGSGGGFYWFSGVNNNCNRCIAHNNTGTGFYAGQVGIMRNCIADSNSGRGYYNLGTASCHMYNCDFYNNGSHGMDVGAAFIVIENCNFIDNAGWGIAAYYAVIRNCGFGSGTAANTLGAVSTLFKTESDRVTYAADVTPWVDPANGDFRINLATAKGAGRGSFLQTQGGYSGAVGYPDIGSAQHQDSGGGGIPIARGMHGGMR